jgi:hypothetical protein
LRANAVKEQADTTGGLIANLTETHTHQIESLIRDNTKAMKKILSLEQPILPIQRMMKRKGKEKKDKRNSSTHQSVSTVERSIRPKQKASAGN